MRTEPTDPTADPIIPTDDVPADPQEDVTVTDPTDPIIPTDDVPADPPTVVDTVDALTAAIDAALDLADPATGTVPAVGIDAVKVLTRKAADRARASAYLNTVTMGALTAVPVNLPRATAAASIGHALTVVDAPTDPIADAVRGVLTLRYAAEDIILALTDDSAREKVRAAVDAALTADPTRPEGFVPAAAARKRSGGTSSGGSSSGAKSGAGTVVKHALLTIPADGSAMTLGDSARAVSGLVKDGQEYHPTASSIRQALDNGSIPGVVREDVTVTLKDGSSKLIIGFKVSDPTVFVRPSATDAAADDPSDDVTGDDVPADVPAEPTA